MTALLRPDTAPVPEGLSVSGWVCVEPDGTPRWETASQTVERSLRACFGRADDFRLHDLAEAGWRCVPITLATPARHPADPPPGGEDRNALAPERHDAEVARAEDGADRDGREA